MVCDNESLTTSISNWPVTNNEPSQIRSTVILSLSPYEWRILKENNRPAVLAVSRNIGVQGLDALL